MIGTPGMKFLPVSAFGPFPWPNGAMELALYALLSMPVLGLAVASVYLWVSTFVR